jgi:hypothetical protein
METLALLRQVALCGAEICIVEASLAPSMPGHESADVTAEFADGFGGGEVE